VCRGPAAASGCLRHDAGDAALCADLRRAGPRRRRGRWWRSSAWTTSAAQGARTRPGSGTIRGGYGNPVRALNTSGAARSRHRPGLPRRAGAARPGCGRGRGVTRSASSSTSSTRTSMSGGRRRPTSRSW
jgi:hypothetical protein